MRKLIVSMNVTLDGYISGPDNELDWHFRYWNEEMGRHAELELSRADTILLGGATYRAMAGYWPDRGRDLSFAREDLAFADMMNRYEKVVFTRSPEEMGWGNSRVVRGGVGEEVKRLKRQPGRHMIVYGSGRLVASLMEQGLVDEYVLWVHPVFLGQGQPMFRRPDRQLTLVLQKTKQFDSGVVVLYYEHRAGQ